MGIPEKIETHTVELQPDETVVLMPCAGYLGIEKSVDRDHVYKATTDRLRAMDSDPDLGWFGSLEMAQTHFPGHPVEKSTSHSLCPDCLALYYDDLNKRVRERQSA